jgi:hypothetical protein
VTHRHGADPVSLIGGLVFAAAGVVVLAGRIDLLDQARWLWPALLVVTGLVLLIGAARKGRAG